MIAIYQAKKINIRSGGAVITPWEIDELSADWIHALTCDIPDTVAAHNQKIAELRREFYARNLPKYTH